MYFLSIACTSSPMIRVGLTQTIERIKVAAIIFAAATFTVGQVSELSETAYKECWSHPISGNVIGTSINSGDRIVFAESGGTIRAIDVQDGEALWSAELGGQIVSNLIADDRYIYVATTQNIGSETHKSAALLRSLNPESGIPVNSTTIQSNGPFRIGLVKDGVVLIDRGSIIWSFADGLESIRWMRRSDESIVNDPLFSNETVIFISEDNKTVVISTEDGKVLDRRDSKIKPSAAIALDAAVAVVGDRRGNLKQFQFGRESPAWTFRTGGSIAHILTAGDRLIVSSFDNFVYMISSSSGQVIWRRRLDGRLRFRPVVNDGAIFLSVNGQPEIDVVSVDNGKTINRIQLDKNAIPVDVLHDKLNQMIVIQTLDRMAAYKTSGCSKK